MNVTAPIATNAEGLTKPLFSYRNSNACLSIFSRKNNYLRNSKRFERVPTRILLTMKREGGFPAAKCGAIQTVLHPLASFRRSSRSQPCKYFPSLTCHAAIARQRSRPRSTALPVRATCKLILRPGVPVPVEPRRWQRCSPRWTWRGIPRPRLQADRSGKPFCDQTPVADVAQSGYVVAKSSCSGLGLTGHPVNTGK